MKITIEIKDKDIKKLMSLLSKSDIDILAFGQVEKEYEYIPTSPLINKDWIPIPNPTITNTGTSTTPVNTDRFTYVHC